MNPNEAQIADELRPASLNPYWLNYFKMSVYLLAMAILVALGFGLSSYLSSTWIAVLSGLSILVLLALLASRLMKPLAFLNLPLLILVCLISGVMLSQLTRDMRQLQMALCILFLNYLLLSSIDYIVKFEFQGFNLLLVILAISFSLVGSLLIFVEGNNLLQLIWTLATFLCLDILLYTLMQQVLQTEDKAVLPMLSGVVLLHIALFMNGILLLSV